MDIRRVILGAALAMLAYALWNAWQADYPKMQNTTPAVQIQNQSSDGALLPAKLSATDTNARPSTQSFSDNTTSVDALNTVSVKTDVLQLEVDLLQGDIISASLLDYPESVDTPDKPFLLLNSNAQTRYVANSNLLVTENSKIKQLNTKFSANQKSYRLQEGQDELAVTLSATDESGLSIQKVLKFKRGSYAVDVSYFLANNGDAPWVGYVNTQVVRKQPEKEKTSPFVMNSYTGASYSNPGHHRYQKLSFKDMDKSALDVSVEGGWLAMQQHYFLTAWIPPANETSRFYSRASLGSYAIGSVSQAIKLLPGQTKTFSSKLYTGPEVADNLKALAPGLDLTIDYGWLWFISSLLFSVMKTIYTVVGNWGFAIVLVTVLIKLAFYRLSASSYRSMAGMRKLQPKIQALRERYGDDKAKMSQETMALYREEKVNPLSGCLPLLVQIPVFIALYWVLAESVELRQAPFIFWIKDLAMPDPYHVLPLIMGGTMFIQQKLNPTPPDPMQAKMMMLLPVFFTALFWNFPSGLVLYWTVNNTLTILQQWYITRKYEAAPAHA